MTPILLTKQGGMLGPFASLFGIIMDGIFSVMSSLGIVNIGICIIIFTIITRILMTPLSYKQAKSQKIMAVIQPQIALIQKKYKGKEIPHKIICTELLKVLLNKKETKFISGLNHRSISKTSRGI